METFFPVRFGASVREVRAACHSFERANDTSYLGTAQDDIERIFMFKNDRLVSITHVLNTDAFVKVSAAMAKKYGKREMKTDDGNTFYSTWSFPQYNATVNLVMNNSEGVFMMILAAQ